MTAAEKSAAEERRRRDIDRARERLERESEAKMYGVVSFHFQAGRIVRVETTTSHKFGET